MAFHVGGDFIRRVVLVGRSQVVCFPVQNEVLAAVSEKEVYLPGYIPRADMEFQIADGVRHGAEFRNPVPRQNGLQFLRGNLAYGVEKWELGLGVFGCDFRGFERGGVLWRDFRA